MKRLLLPAWLTDLPAATAVVVHQMALLRLVEGVARLERGQETARLRVMLRAKALARG
jgi:hypothetical protein